MLWNADDLGMTLRYRAAESAAQALGVSIQALGVREPDDFGDAFVRMTKEMPGGILMVTNSLTLSSKARLRVRHRKSAAGDVSSRFPREGWPIDHTVRITKKATTAWQRLSTASLRAPILQNCPSSARPGFAWLLIQRQPMRSALPCRHCFWLRPTRSSSDKARLPRLRPR